jgi:hypothetical protein
MEVKKQLVETNWFHTATFIWLHDSTGMGWKDKSAISKPVNMNISLLEPNQKFQLINKAERIAILLPDNQNLNLQKSKDKLRLLNGITDISEDTLKVTEEELEFPAPEIANIEGTIEDSSKFYNPRWFALAISPIDTENFDVTTNSICLYKNSAYIKRTKSGSVYGNLQLENGKPFAWAILTLEILITDNPNTDDIDEEQILIFKAQSNQHGDFVIPLNEFPALETNSLNKVFDAKLIAKSCSLVNQLPDIESVNDLQMESIEDEYTFLEEISFQISPGDHLRLSSASQKSLVVKAG